MIKRVLGAVPGMPKRPGAGRFFYPRLGYGQISDALHRAAASSGATVTLDANVTRVLVTGGRVNGVEVEAAGTTRVLPATSVLSTIPVTVLARLVRSDAGSPRLRRQGTLQQRSMVLIYLSLDDASVHRIRRALFSRDVDPHQPFVRAEELLADDRARPHGVVRRAAVRAGRRGMVDDRRGAWRAGSCATSNSGPWPGAPREAVQVRRLPHAYPLYTKAIARRSMRLMAGSPASKV
jgi:protoporphyrinogen oxidase